MEGSRKVGLRLKRERVVSSIDRCPTHMISILDLDLTHFSLDSNTGEVGARCETDVHYLLGGVGVDIMSSIAKRKSLFVNERKLQ